MSKPTTPKTPTTADFDAALARLAAADETVRSTRERITALEARAGTLDIEAIQLETARGKAYAAGELSEAASVGKKYAANRADWADAHAAVKAMNQGMDAMMVAVLDAEDDANRLHRAILDALYETERAALVESLRPTATRVWRAFLAAGYHLPFEAWMSDLVASVHPGDAVLFAADVGLPIQELSPRSSLIPGDPRRGDQRRSDLNAIREKMRAGGVDLAQAA